MTWEQLEQLPDHVAGEIELWNGRVVHCRKPPPEHQRYTGLLWTALRHEAARAMREYPDECWETDFECNVFFGEDGKDDFVTPDFLVYGCREHEFDDIRAFDVRLVGEVLSPANTGPLREAKKGRYADARIPWYWEVDLGRNPRRITAVRSYVLETTLGRLPEGVTPLREANYVLVHQWTPKEDKSGIEAGFPFPIRIPWSDLEF
jgi:Uma2 family endonuclease